MARPTEKMIQRDRSMLDLHVLNLEITVESYNFLKAYAKAKRKPMAGVIDEIIRGKREKYLERRIIQSEKSSLNSSSEVA